MQGWARIVGVASTLGVMLTPFALASQRGKLTVEKIEYKGWKNNLKLSNGEVELVVTLDVGPRVIRFAPVGGKNVFKEWDDQLGKSGEKDWMIRGGHRLWTAPEDLTRTYAPDNEPIEYTENRGQVTLIKKPDQYGIKKEMMITLGDSGGNVNVQHRITNAGQETAQLAVWALTVMPAGGTEIIPLPPKRPHPGSPRNAKAPSDFWPNVQMSFWPFFDFKDTRWTFGQKYITLTTDLKKGPTKIGLNHQQDWVAYLNDGTLFVKRFPYQVGQTYPDGGVNYETFTSGDMLEMESLGPIVTLKPGEAIHHPELWHLFTSVKAITDEASIDANVRSLIK